MRAKIHRCFIAAGADVDLHPLQAALRARDVQLQAAAGPRDGASRQAALIDDVARADLVLGIVSPAMGAGVPFAIGLAAGFGRSVLLLAAPGMADIPEALAGFPAAQPDLADRAAIDALLAPLLASRGGPSRQRGDANAHGDTAADTAANTEDGATRTADTGTRLAQAVRDGDGPALERLVAQALRADASDLTVEVPPGEQQIDLVLWSDLLVAGVGSPFPIEIKKRLPAREHAVRSLEQLDRSMASIGARSGMLLYGAAPNLDPSVWHTHPHVLAMSIEQLLSRLQRERMVDILAAWQTERDAAASHQT